MIGREGTARLLSLLLSLGLDQGVTLGGQSAADFAHPGELDFGLFDGHLSRAGANALDHRFHPQSHVDIRGHQDQGGRVKLGERVADAADARLSIQDPESTRTDLERLCSLGTDHGQVDDVLGHLSRLKLSVVTIIPDEQENPAPVARPDSMGQEAGYRRKFLDDGNFLVPVARLWRNFRGIGKKSRVFRDGIGTIGDDRFAKVNLGVEHRHFEQEHSAQPGVAGQVGVAAKRDPAISRSERGVGHHPNLLGLHHRGHSRRRRIGSPDRRRNRGGRSGGEHRPVQLSRVLAERDVAALSQILEYVDRAERSTPRRGANSHHAEILRSPGEPADLVVDGPRGESRSSCRQVLDLGHDRPGPFHFFLADRGGSGSPQAVSQAEGHHRLQERIGANHRVNLLGVREFAFRVAAENRHQGEAIGHGLLGTLAVRVDRVYENVEARRSKFSDVRSRGVDRREHRFVIQAVFPALLKTIAIKPVERVGSLGFHHRSRIGCRCRSRSRVGNVFRLDGGNLRGRGLDQFRRNGADQDVVNEDLGLAGTRVKVEDELLDIRPFKTHRALRRGAEDANLPVDRGLQFDQLQALPVIGVFVERPRDQEIRRSLGFGIGVGRQDHSCEELHPGPICPEKQFQGEILGDGDVRSRVAEKERTSHAGVERDPLGHQPVMRRALSSVVLDRGDRRVGLFLVPNDPGALESIADHRRIVIVTQDRMADQGRRNREQPCREAGCHSPRVLRARESHETSMSHRHPSPRDPW